MRRTLIDGSLRLKRELVEKIAQHPKADVAQFIDELLRFADFGGEDVQLLEGLILNIEECIQDIQISVDSPARHPTIKAQVKSPSSGHYLYVRRQLAGQKREEKGCGSIPFKPGLSYSFKSLSTGEVRTARCSSVFIPKGVTWEHLIQNPECRVGFDFLDGNLNYVASEIYRFPDCMDEDFAPQRCAIAEIRPAIVGDTEKIQPNASDRPIQSIDLSRVPQPVYASILVHDEQSARDLVKFLTDCLELSQILPDCEWSLKQFSNQLVVVDGNQKEVLVYGNHCLSLMMMLDPFLNLLEQIAAAVLESSSVTRSWQEKARNLNLRVLAASGHNGDQAFSVLLGVTSSSHRP